MIEAIKQLERSGIIDQIILTKSDISLGSLTNFNTTIRSIAEIQPKRKRVTESIWGIDGDLDFSYPEVYERRKFNIEFNIYEFCGDVFDQRDAFVDWLKSYEGTGTLSFANSHKRCTYTGLRVDIGNFVKDGNRPEWVLNVSISTNPRYTKEGEQRI